MILFIFFLNLHRSLLNNFVAKPIGVTRPKKTKAITKGVVIFPSKIQNLNHNKLKRS